MKNEISQDLKEMSYGELQDLICEVLRSEQEEIDHTKTIQEITRDDLKKMISAIARETAWQNASKRFQVEEELQDKWNHAFKSVVLPDDD